MKNIENVSIFRGGAVGTAMGYAIALRFGVMSGVLAGIVTAVVMCDPLRFFRARQNVQGELDEIRQGLTADMQKFGKRWERQIPWAVNGLKIILTSGLIFISYIPACLLWQRYFWEMPAVSGRWSMYDTGTAVTFTVIFNVLGLAIISGLLVWSNLKEKIECSGALSWPITKRLIDWADKFFNRISEGLSERAITAFTELICSFCDSFAETFRHRRKQTECNFRIIFFLSGLSILFSVILVISPSKWVMIPIWGSVVLLAALMTVDIALMVLVRCITSATEAAAGGAAVAVWNERCIYPHFNAGLSGDWIRFAVFMVAGGMTGMGIYGLRKHLLANEMRDRPSLVGDIIG